MKCCGCSRSGQHAVGLGFGLLCHHMVASLGGPSRLTTITAAVGDEEMQGMAVQEGCELWSTKKNWKNPGAALVPGTCQTHPV